MDRFGEKLRTLRRRHTMTQWELTQALGYASQSYIHELESGKKQPTAEFIVKVARLFQVSTDQLLLDEIDLMPPSDGPKSDETP